VVDAVDGEGQRDDSPSEGDGAAIVPDVKNLNRDLRLEDTLAIVESGLAVEGDSAKLERQLETSYAERGLK
jgi:hypothetical protein